MRATFKKMDEDGLGHTDLDERSFLIEMRTGDTVINKYKI